MRIPTPSTVSDKLLKRLQKLHALANCPTGNVHETASAAARMTEIMLEHGISELNFKKMVFDRALISDKKLTTWQEILVGRLSVAAGCRAVLQGKKDFWIIGEATLILTVQYQFQAILQDIERLQKLYVGAKKRTSPHTSFCVGAVHEVVRRVETKKQEMVRDLKRRSDLGQEWKTPNSQISQALVWLEKGVSDDDVLSTFNLEGAKIGNGRKRTTTVNHHDAYYAGRRAGATIALDASGAQAVGPEKTSLGSGRW